MIKENDKIKFKMKLKYLIIFAIVLGMLIGGGLFFYFFINAGSSESFSIDSVLIKAAIKSSGSLESKIKLTNLAVDETFKITLDDLSGFASVREEIAIRGGASEIITISFLSPGDKLPGIYTGSLAVSNSKDTKIVPVILEIESSDVLFDSNTAIFPVGKIKVGDKINAEIKVFDLARIGTSSVELSYFIQDFNGNQLFSESENIIVKDQALITKGFDLPFNLATGDYLFGVVMRYRDSVGTSSQFFTVNPKATSELFSNTFYFSIAFLIVLIFFMIFVIASFYSRDKLLVELKKHYESERKKQEEYLESKMMENECKLKSREEKELNRHLFNKLKIDRAKEIEHLHKERVKTIKKLKRSSGNKSLMEKQLSKWKKEGYNISMLKEPSIKDIQKQVVEWKKKGYKTDIFTKRKV